MSDLRAYVANCLFHGHTITRDGSSCIRDTIEFNCDGLVVVLKQKASVITTAKPELGGQFRETFEILVKDVAPDDVQKTLTVIDRICWLLSFAGLSRVLCYGYDYPDGSGGSSRKTVSGVATYFRPTFYIHDGGMIKSFVEQTYPNFVLLEQPRKLNVVIDYLHYADLPIQPTESKLILAFVLLENLKHTYAHSKAIPFSNGFFRRPNKTTWSFKDLLNQMFSEVGMHPSLDSVKILRNEIIHTGLSQLSHDQLWKMYENIHDLLREYILKLLGYKGRYLVYSSINRTEAVI